MAIRNILQDTDPTLRKKSRIVEKFDERLWTLLDDMEETMKIAEGVGLAAPQVGVLRRVFIVDGGEVGIIEVINPKIIRTYGNIEGTEGCLSSPGKYAYVNRPEKVKIQAQDRFGKSFVAIGEEIVARAFCHENDHLDGILFLDIAIRMVEDE